MTVPEEFKFIKKCFSKQITSNELETISGLSNDFDHLVHSIFDMSLLKTLLSSNMTRFTRT